MPPKASGGDGERHSTRKLRETKEERAISGGGGGDSDGDRRKLEEERLMRGRKIDQMKGRKKELYTERERERERERAES